MTDKQNRMLQAIEKKVDAEWDNLSSWEQKFVEDTLERFRMYGNRTLISGRQWEFIERIFDKICVGSLT